MKTFLALLLKRPLVIFYYYKYYNRQKYYRENVWSMRKKVVSITNFHLNNGRGYKEILISLGYDGYDTIKDFNMWNDLPVITKNELRKIDIDYKKKGLFSVNGHTGGSTGEPLKYLMSVKDYSIGMALLFLGWKSAGYRLGDKVAIIAGRSLVGPQDNFLAFLKRTTNDYFLNFKHFTAIDMSEETLTNYCSILNKWKPKFLRGYVSSIMILANYIEKNNIELVFEIKGIMTTAENLLDQQRRYIESVFNTKVFDNYGLEDSGVSAYECTHHNGLHIDNERAYLQVLENGITKDIGEGIIVGTSLYNKDFPFIKYDTGDIGKIEKIKCSCGIEGRMITKLQGRTTDYLEINGIKIGGPVLTTIWNNTNINQYQIIQLNKNSIELRLVKGDKYNINNENDIIERFNSYFGDISIEIKYFDILKPLNGNKLKYIVKEENMNE